MKQDPAIRDIIGDMEHLAAEMVAGKISILRGTHIEVTLTNLLVKAANTVRAQQYQIIELEEANTALARIERAHGVATEGLNDHYQQLIVENEKLKKRNANQAALIDAINQGRAKKVPGGGWSHDDIPHREVTTP
jgi:PBP1b-binding outer membrane lipoprotein LpoB